MITDFIHSFLFQDSPIIKNNDNIHTTVFMDSSKEGWVGIPHGRVVCSFSGFNIDDGESLHLFQRNGFLHPISILAVLDETMGWAGFMAYANGGVSVRLNYQFLRPIRVAEKLVLFGRGEKVMGNISKRMLFWASGGGSVMHEDGSFEPVIVSSGQWYAMKALTDQMKKELIPAKLTRKIFSIAARYNTSFLIPR